MKVIKTDETIKAKGQGLSFLGLYELALHISVVSSLNGLWDTMTSESVKVGHS